MNDTDELDIDNIYPAEMKRRKAFLNLLQNLDEKVVDSVHEMALRAKSIYDDATKVEIKSAKVISDGLITVYLDLEIFRTNNRAIVTLHQAFNLGDKGEVIDGTPVSAAAKSLDLISVEDFTLTDAEAKKASIVFGSHDDEMMGQKRYEVKYIIEQTRDGDRYVMVKAYAYGRDEVANGFIRS